MICHGDNNNSHLLKNNSDCFFPILLFVPWKEKKPNESVSDVCGEWVPSKKFWSPFPSCSVEVSKFEELQALSENENIKRLAVYHKYH